MIQKTPKGSETLNDNSKWDHSDFHRQKSQHWLQQHKPQAMAFAVLLSVLLLVIFALPNLVTPVQSEKPEASVSNAISPSTANKNTSDGKIESPWEEAQLTKARREAQDILAKLLDRQAQLETMHVELWGQDSFTEAMELAATGDELYKQRQFPEAQEQYQLTLEQFEILLLQAEVVFQQAVSDGYQAIEDQQVNVARENFALATKIRPNNDNAINGMKRAEALHEVIVLLDKATNEQSNSLEQALGSVEQALTLDGESNAALKKKAEIKFSINERDFSAAMGQGYSGLYQGQFTKAISAFQQAIKLKPQETAAIEALAQARSQQTQSALESTLVKAQKFEATENWQQANEHYQQALKRDASLVDARIGDIRSAARLQLDNSLEKLLAKPLRLADDAVYAQAQQLLSDAHSVQPQGKRIRAQSEQLALAIRSARHPIAVVLKSNNETQVTLYKFGQLGNFTQRAIELTPGRYTAVGSRSGYRDVREDFIVQANSQNQTLVIQCVEKISLDG